MTGIFIIGLVIAGYFGYMKFYYPKYKAQFEENEQKVTKKWNENKDEILDEYFANPDKFGLLTKAVKSKNIKGVISGKIPKNFKSKLLSGIADAVTFTEKVDMSHSYLVVTDEEFYYLAFDGKKCFVNEVFDYKNIYNINVVKNELNFDYKNEKLVFVIDNESPIAISGYPRYNIHERHKTATSNDRSLNYFVREYLAYEPTNNALFTQSNKAVTFNMDALKVSPEQAIDYKVREYLVKGFKQKMGI